MKFLYSVNLSYHWNDIAMMIEENYSSEYNENDLVIMAIHHHKTIEQIKENNSNYNKIIIYQLEPLVENHWWKKDYIISRLEGADEIWDYDLDNIEILKSYGIQAKYRPFVYSKSLKRVVNSENPDIDVFFYGTLTEHRSKELEIITNCGLIGRTTIWSYGLSKELLDEFISRSKIILDLHSNDFVDEYIQKQSRICYALINDKCVVSEKSKKNYFSDLIVEVEKNDIKEVLENLLDNDKWKEYSNVSERFKKMTNKVSTGICMISMFKNESKGILRMLESVWKYIDYYIFQDNGSTDGTPEIVKQFFLDKNIPGFIYTVEEGWVSFGWNRDHFLQKALQTNHGCNWIMKMDCDEYLEVDDNFDWSYFENKNTQSFHVTAQNPGCIYYRAWIWNSKLPWKFYHNVAHECIYLDNEIGENFERVNLPREFRMIGTNDGESYTVRTKYISDALKLEEQLIREDTMLQDPYHFWYIAKSYADCYDGDFYPLKESHSNEFAERALFYYQEYLKYTNPQGINEMAYFTMFAIGDLYRYLKNNELAIEYYKNAEKFAPPRNEHIVRLARIYHFLGQYDRMLEQTTRLIDENRKLPFPEYCFLLDSNFYSDSGTYVHDLHQLAIDLNLNKIKVYSTPSIEQFKIQKKINSRLWIVDNFYENPESIREFAVQQEFEPNLELYKGSRTKEQFIVPGTKEAFERILNRSIIKWTETHGMCGRFQYCTAQDSLVYHYDDQTWAGMIYLTPNAPYSAGTSFFAHKKTKLRNENDFENVNPFEGGFYDRTKFELVDTAGNVFNRLVLFDAKCIHSANEYFGTDITNSRLFHIFFFD